MSSHCASFVPAFKFSSKSQLEEHGDTTCNLISTNALHGHVLYVFATCSLTFVVQGGSKTNATFKVECCPTLTFGQIPNKAAVVQIVYLWAPTLLMSDGLFGILRGLNMESEITI